MFMHIIIFYKIGRYYLLCMLFNLKLLFSILKIINSLFCITKLKQILKNGPNPMFGPCKRNPINFVSTLFLQSCFPVNSFS